MSKVKKFTWQALNVEHLQRFDELFSACPAPDGFQSSEFASYADYLRAAFVALMYTRVDPDRSQGIEQIAEVCVEAFNPNAKAKMKVVAYYQARKETVNHISERTFSHLMTATNENGEASYPVFSSAFANISVKDYATKLAKISVERFNAIEQAYDNLRANNTLANRAGFSLAFMWALTSLPDLDRQIAVYNDKPAAPWLVQSFFLEGAYLHFTKQSKTSPMSMKLLRLSFVQKLRRIARFGQNTSSPRRSQA